MPETVPYRMTQTLQAALGFCGVEGPFRSSSEKALRVLRRNKEALLTLLEVCPRFHTTSTFCFFSFSGKALRVLRRNKEALLTLLEVCPCFHTTFFFLSSSENALRVLRRNKEALLTLLKVCPCVHTISTFCFVFRSRTASTFRPMRSTLRAVISYRAFFPPFFAGLCVRSAGGLDVGALE